MPAGSIDYATFLDVSDDVKPWLQIPDSDVSKDATLDLITAMGCEWTQAYIGGPVATATFHRRFDGSAGLNSGYIMLPKYPVLQVISVVEFNGNASTSLSEIAPGTSGGDGFQCTYSTGRLTRVLGGIYNRPWFPGSRNVEVTWAAGYNPVPPTIRLATLELVGHWFRNTQQATASGRPSGDYDPGVTSGLWAGVPNRITSLLEPYVQMGLA